MNLYKSLFLLLLLSIQSLVVGQNTSSSSEILNQLESLKKVGSVLYIAAHPDDENTRFITYLTQKEHVDVSYLSLTRGDGGQNLIGTEIGEQLGVIRTQELLAARRIDGAKQYFTRAVDFGYSKTPEETLKIWDRNSILSDVVWVIRQVQPDVIVTRFSPQVNPEKPTHGHHTASAMLALEAFHAASDPQMFPEQLKHVGVWKTKSIYWNTSYWFYGSVEKMDAQVAKDPYKYLKIDVNTYLPLLGKSGSDVSAHSRSQHKSQGFGSSPDLASQWEYLELLNGENLRPSLIEGFATTYKDRGLSTKLDKSIQSVIDDFDPFNPAKSIAALLEIRSQIDALQDGQIKNKKQAKINEIILACAGVKANAFTKEQRVFVGQKIATSLEIRSNDPIRITGLKTEGFEVDTKWDASAESAHYFSHNLEWEVPEMGVSQPYWLKKDKKSGMYQVDDVLEIGKAENDYPFYVILDLEVQGQTVACRVPVQYATSDPVKGPIIQPLVVTPNVMLNIENDVYVFANGKTKEIQVEVVAGKPNVSGYLELFLPEGWKCEPAFHKTTLGNSGEKKQFSFKITPALGQQEQKVRAIFKDNSLVYSMGIYQMNYDHIPNVAMFPTAETKVVSLDLKTTGTKIGYIMGAGDKVPESIGEMGYSVEMLTINDVLTKNLDAYQAIVLGIRGLNTLEDISSINNKITDYVNKGGNFVMQYNTSHRLKSQPLGPYQIELSRDRVTEEDANVLVRKPDHPVINSPNVITNYDFDNWVQERGLYFPNKWDDKFEAILSMSDTGEPISNGSLLIANHGKGHIVYTGISFFRELPAGVPGAYKLLANILSL